MPAMPKPAIMRAQLAGSGMAGATNGVRRNDRSAPFRVPKPIICPASLMSLAACNTQPDAGAIREFKSSAPAAVQRVATRPPLVRLEPMIVPASFKALADSQKSELLQAARLRPTKASGDSPYHKTEAVPVVCLVGRDVCDETCRTSVKGRGSKCADGTEANHRAIILNEMIRENAPS
jgi:hypothetical protein